MPEFRQASEIAVDARGDGWTARTVADGRHIPGLAMSARLWQIEAGMRGPEQRWDEERERLLYVVSGEGSLEVAGNTTAIGREDVAWIERGDRFRLCAGGAGPLVVLDATSA